MGPCAEPASPSSSTHGPAVLSPVSLHFTFCMLPGLSQQLHFVTAPPEEDGGDVDSETSSESPWFAPHTWAGQQVPHCKLLLRAQAPLLLYIHCCVFSIKTTLYGFSHIH